MRKKNQHTCKCNRDTPDPYIIQMIRSSDDLNPITDGSLSSLGGSFCIKSSNEQPSYYWTHVEPKKPHKKHPNVIFSPVATGVLLPSQFEMSQSISGILVRFTYTMYIENIIVVRMKIIQAICCFISVLFVNHAQFVLARTKAFAWRIIPVLFTY